MCHVQKLVFPATANVLQTRQTRLIVYQEELFYQETFQENYGVYVRQEGAQVGYTTKCNKCTAKQRGVAQRS